MKHAFSQTAVWVTVSATLALLLLAGPMRAADDVDFSTSPTMGESGYDAPGFATQTPLSPEWSARADELRHDQVVRQSMSGLIRNLRESFRDDEHKSPVARLVTAFAGELEWNEPLGQFQFKPGADPKALLAREMTGMTHESLLGLASELPTDSSGDRFVSSLAKGAAQSLVFEKPSALRFRTQPLIEGVTGGVSGLLSDASAKAPATSALAAWAGQIGWDEERGKFALKPSGQDNVTPEQAATTAVQAKLAELAPRMITRKDPFSQALASGVAGSAQVKGPFSVEFRTQPFVEGFTGGLTGTLAAAADNAPFAGVLSAWAGQLAWNEDAGKFALKPSGQQNVTPEQAATAAVQAKLAELAPRVASGNDVFSRALADTTRDFARGVQVTGPLSLKYANIAPQNDKGETKTAFRLSSTDIVFRYIENFKVQGRQDLLTPMVQKLALFHDDKVDGLLRTYLANAHFAGGEAYATPYQFDMTKTLALGTPNATFALAGPVQGVGNTWNWAKVTGQFQSLLGQGNVTMDLAGRFGIRGTHDAMYQAGQIGLNFRLGSDSTFRAALALDAHHKRAEHVFTLSHKLGKAMTMSTTYGRPFGSDEPNVACQLAGQLGPDWNVAMAFSGKYHDQPNTQLNVTGKLSHGLQLALALADEAGKPRDLNCSLTGELAKGLTMSVSYLDQKGARNAVAQLNGQIARNTTLAVALTDQAAQPRNVTCALNSQLLDNLNLTVNYQDQNAQRNLTGQLAGSIEFD